MDGFKQIAFWVKPDEHRLIKMIAAERGQSMRDLVLEAMIPFFAQYVRKSVYDADKETVIPESVNSHV